MSQETNAMPVQHAHDDADRIHHDWDDALSRHDVEALLALYAPDAVLESPLIPHLLKVERGICRGRDEIRRLLEILAERQPRVRQFYRRGYFTDGQTLMWEYPRQRPDGEQMDFVEVMELKNGLIQRHRVYWGWFGVNVIEENLHFK
jgi:ketosteroid isomerase-like protein